MEEETGAVEVRLSRDLTFIGATMLGIGATLGAGIFVLLGFAIGAAGPAILLAIVLNGTIVGLTAITYADLGTTFPEAGGGYLWVREALPNPLAFATGWMLWFGHMVAGALGGLGFGHYVAWILEARGWLGPLSPQGAAILVALMVTGVFVALGYIGTRARRRGVDAMGFLKVAILIVTVAFGFVALAGAPANSLQPFAPFDKFGILAAMVLTYVAFQGFEGIAQAGEEVREPERTIPRAMFVSLAIIVILYLGVAFVALAATTPTSGGSIWSWLQGFGVVAIVEVGRQLVPVIGAPLLVFGGLIATLAAVNTTLFSASRLSFAMGRDRILPKALGRVHPTYRAPSTAILLSGLVMLSLVLFAQPEVVASAAGLAFLLAFILVNVAFIRYRIRHPSERRGFHSPFFPVFPSLAIGANLVLAIFLWVSRGPGELAWPAIGLWIAIGLILYYPLRGREEIAKALPKRIDVAQLLAFRAPPVELERYRVLVPLRDFEDHSIARLGARLAAARDGELALLNVLEIPRTLPAKAIRFHYVDERIKGLRKMEKEVRDIGATTRTTVRIGHVPYDIILRTIDEEDVNLLVLGWPGGGPESDFRILGDTIDFLVQRAPCDVVVARTSGMSESTQSILLTARVPEHAEGAAELASALARGAGARVLVLEIAEEGRAGAAVAELLLDAVRRHGVHADLKRAGGKAAEAIVAESANHGLLVVGVGKTGVLSRTSFGPVVDDIAPKAKCPILLFRKGTPPASAG